MLLPPARLHPIARRALSGASALALVLLLGAGMLSPAAELRSGTASIAASKPAIDATFPSSPDHPASSDCCCGLMPRPQDQVWVVSCRGAGCDETDPALLKYSFYVQGEGWKDSNQAAFLAAHDPAARVAIFIHGNRVSSGEAYDVGLSVYKAFAQQARSNQTVRFVTWSWPSDRIDSGPLEDVRVKAARTKPAGLHLAKFIASLRPAPRVTVIGYSFGARIATAALHLLGGGSESGAALDPAPPADRPPARAVLIAPALDNHWLLPGHRHGLALGQVDRMLIITNSCDAVLKRYHLLYCGARRRTGPEALGYTGLVGAGRLGADRAKISETDACCRVGKEHSWWLYFESPSIVGEMAPYVFD